MPHIGLSRGGCPGLLQGGAPAPRAASLPPDRLHQSRTESLPPPRRHEVQVIQKPVAPVVLHREAEREDGVPERLAVPLRDPHAPAVLAREEVLERRPRLRQLQRQPANPLNRARERAIQAELSQLELANSLLRQQLSANNVLLDLANAKRRLLLAELNNIENEINALQDVIDDKRRSLSEQVISDTTAESTQISNHQLLHKQSLINQRISEELLAASNQISTLSRRNIQTTQQLDHLTQLESALDQQISVLEGSLLLSRILHQEKQALPDVRIDRSLTDSVADMRLRQFEISQQREQLRNQEAYLNRLLNQLPEEQRDSLREDLQQLIRSRATLIEQLSTHINTLLGEAVALQINQDQLQQLSGKLRQTIDDQLFWVASNPPINRTWITSLPSQMRDQLQDLQPLAQGLRLLRTLADNVGWLILLLGCQLAGELLVRLTQIPLTADSAPAATTRSGRSLPAG